MKNKGRSAKIITYIIALISSLTGLGIMCYALQKANTNIIEQQTAIIFGATCSIIGYVIARCVEKLSSESARVATDTETDTETARVATDTEIKEKIESKPEAPFLFVLAFIIIVIIIRIIMSFGK